MGKEKIKIAVIGCGRFAKNFVPLFKAHPEVEKVYVCDQRRERAEEYAQKFTVDVIDSFEEALSSEEINSVAIFTQRFAHGKSVTDDFFHTQKPRVRIRTYRGTHLQRKLRPRPQRQTAPHRLKARKDGGTGCNERKNG